MRLSKHEINSIYHLTKKYFLEDAKVYLFGSRIRDDLRGGDIDLLIKAREDLCTYDNKIKFNIALQKAIGERKIDVIFDDKNLKKQQAFYQSIHKTKQLITKQL